MKDAIEIKNLTKSYGKARGVENINLTIEKGTIRSSFDDLTVKKCLSILLPYLNLYHQDIFY